MVIQQVVKTSPQTRVQGQMKILILRMRMIYDPQKKWKFTKFLRGRFKNGRRKIYVEWEDSSMTCEPDQCFDDEVLEMINRKFTKLDTVRKSCFKRNY